MHRLLLDLERHPTLQLHPALAIDVLVLFVYVPEGDTELVKIRDRDALAEGPADLSDLPT